MALVGVPDHGLARPPRLVHAIEFLIQWQYNNTMHRSIALATCGVIAVSGSGSAQEVGRELVTLRGTVVDSADHPVPRALVYLSLKRVFGQTDDNGEFILAEIEPGVDSLQVRAFGYFPRDFRLSVLDSAQGVVDIGSIKLDPGPLPTLAFTATVRDTLRDQPIIGAQVMLNDRVIGETDSAGTFSATGLSIDWGINVVLVRSVGYSPLFRTFWVGELNARREFVGALRQKAVDLPVVVVEGDRIVFSYGRLREFWQRRERGLGWFFTRDDIERRNPVFISDMLRTVPGIAVFRTGSTTQIRSSRSGRDCGPSIWIDGIRLFDADDIQLDSNFDLLVRPMDVEAMEVYAGSAQPPARFSGFNSCGAVVVWTR